LVGEVCRKAGISEATYYHWRKKYAGLMPLEMKRLLLTNPALPEIIAATPANPHHAVGRDPGSFTIAVNPLAICRSRMRTFATRVIGERAQRSRNTPAAD
jgi:hypothetical protein